MSTEIDARFWLEQTSPPMHEIFSRVVTSVASWRQLTDRWQGLRIIDASGETHNLPDIGSLSDMQKCVRGLAGGEMRLSTGVSFHCWRFSDGQAEEGFLRLQIDVWNADYTRRHGRERQIEGDGSLSIQTAGPYCAVPSTVNDAPGSDINMRVEDNLEHLSGLLLQTINELHIQKMHVFTDAGMYLPFNSHFAYYRGLDDVVADVQALAAVWSDGLKAYDLGPLSQADPDRDVFLFHPWRSPQQRKDLWAALSSSVSQAGIVSDAGVSNSLSSGKFDSYEMPVGFTVLDYPYFLNAFLGNFYLDVLNNPA